MSLTSIESSQMEEPPAYTTAVQYPVSGVCTEVVCVMYVCTCDCVHVCGFMDTVVCVVYGVCTCVCKYAWIYLVSADCMYVLSLNP